MQWTHDFIIKSHNFMASTSPFHSSSQESENLKKQALRGIKEEFACILLKKNSHVCDCKRSRVSTSQHKSFRKCNANGLTLSRFSIIRLWIFIAQLLGFNMRKKNGNKISDDHVLVVDTHLYTSQLYRKILSLWGNKNGWFYY